LDFCIKPSKVNRQKTTKVKDNNSQPLFLFVTFCRQKVTKNLFAEVLFQIDCLRCKPGVSARFDFWDFGLR
jgi:hypothetical protein